MSGVPHRILFWCGADQVRSIRSVIECINMKNTKKEKLILKLKAIKVIQRQKINLKHAGASNFYIDIKKIYGYPEILDLISDAVIGGIDKRTTCVAGAGYGGIPLATAVSLKLGLGLVLVRDKKKAHGRNVWIDGYVPQAKDRVWIIDDVFTTGKSIEHMTKILKITKAKVIGCSVVVRRSEQKISIPYKSILTMEELL